MPSIETKNMIDFKPFSLDDKDLYKRFLFDGEVRGCEFSFANLYLWGRQSYALCENHIVIFSQFSRRTVYPFPVGTGDKRKVIDAIIADSKERGIPCRITGLTGSAKDLLNTLYPDRFMFHCDEGSFDYVYDINDLAELTGKKYHAKRTHLNRFNEEFPNAYVEPISTDNISYAEEVISIWFSSREKENPNGDYLMEKAAINKALRDYAMLEMEGLILFGGGKPLAVTMGNRLSKDTFDVNFEKACDVGGAYPKINCEFARYIREKYKNIKYLDREEDMGIEGLRRAKKSYHPHHMIEKCWAHLMEDGYDY